MVLALNTNYQFLYTSAGAITDQGKTIVAEGAEKNRVFFKDLVRDDKYFVAIRTLEEGPALFGTWIKVKDRENKGFYLNKNSAVKRLGAIKGVNENEVAKLLENKQEIQLDQITTLFKANHQEGSSESRKPKNESPSPRTGRTNAAAQPAIKNAAAQSAKRNQSQPAPQRKKARVQESSPSSQTDRADLIARRTQITEIVAKEKNNFTRYVGDAQERGVLEALGFNIDRYDDKEAFRKELNQALDHYLQKKDLSRVNPEKVPEDIFRLATKIRLKRANVPVEQHEQINILIDQLTELKIKLLMKAKQIRLKEIDALTKLPLARKYLYDQLFDLMQEQIEGQIHDVLKTHRDAILELMTDEPDNFQISLRDIVKSIRESLHPTADKDALRDLIKWYRKYQSNFVSEIQQGEADSSEHLGEGVCFAYSMRLLQRSMESPNESIDAMDADKILGQDRVMQAAYQMSSLAQQEENGIPLDILRKRGLTSAMALESSPKNFTSTLRDKILSNNIPNRGSILVFGGENHGVFFRVDPKNKILILSDPNIGTLQFEYPESDEKAAQLIGKCIEELVPAFYPDTQQIFVIEVKKGRTRNGKSVR